jgi:hypothetical protein
MTSSDNDHDDTQIRSQELFGARLFRQGRPRAVLEVKSAQISIATHEARLRGYDEAKAAEESRPAAKTKARVKRREKGDG